ncbi:MAG: sterol desaturase family protein [Proteobacteria bacterium]|nr:sterol desaturase family protein [Pseudomonadota bacterium]
MELGKVLLVVALPTIVIASLIEACLLARRRQFDWRALGISLLNFTVRNIVLVAVPFSIATPLFQIAWAHRLATLDLGSWQNLVLLFLGQEFFYYWFHRASHRIRWLWANHSVHHSPNELNLSASYRSAILGKTLGESVFFVPLVWLGFSPKAVFLCLAVNLVYQTWVHTTWIPKLGPLEYILNTPSAHRVHHASNAEYLDANFGGILIVFDRLFGTYVEEREDLPCRYGLVHPQTSYNPLRVEFDQWRSLFADLRKARSIRNFLGFLLLPPDWRPQEESRAHAVGFRH